MSYFDVKPESRYLAPAEINPAFGGYNDPSGTWELTAAGLALPQTIAVIYASRKHGNGWLASIGLAMLANIATMGVAASPLGPVSLAIPAFTGYQAYKAYERSLWHSRTSLIRPTRVPTGLGRALSPRALRRPTPCSTRSVRRRPGRWWTTWASCRGATTPTT